jgi:hypothetical protein
MLGKSYVGFAPWLPSQAWSRGPVVQLNSDDPTLNPEST